MENLIKTGTTCIGLKFRDCVVLAADNRMTSYKIESDKMLKLYEVSKNSVSTIAGIASDAQLFMRWLSSEVKSKRLKLEREVKIKEIAMILNSVQYSLLRSQGAQVASIIGGFDNSPKLFDCSPDGVVSEVENYVSDGSGSIYVLGVLDTQYKEDLNEKQIVELLDNCFKTSFKNDTASGGGYIAKIVNKNGISTLMKKIVKNEFVEKK